MKKIFIVSACIALLTTACHRDNHFLKDTDYRQQVHEQFLKRKAEAAGRSEALFAVFDSTKLTTEQSEALEFLYAYMPLCDLAEYNSDFFLKQIDVAFRTREYFSWGEKIPDDVFRHFVLVHRVNNEYLDTARVVFFNELKDRVKGLSMYDAALEVNHWCHEKVTYRGTDGRTSAPLALVRTSWGRCGEESTLAVTALRAVGIPARQCYTPRWVHTDDNHAWVEVWVDGKWHYLGACEPEPELDVAWFTAPAKRTMMVHTTVYGLYNGPEEKNVQTPLYSRINVLSNYAPTRTVKAKVVDAHGAPVEGATVKFKVYNYAELYPLSENKSAADGTASIVSGMGDVVVWATKDNAYGYSKSTADSTEVTIRLEHKQGAAYEETFVMNVPAEQKAMALPADKVAANAVRLAREDSIRNAYMKTFATKEYADELAKKTNLNNTEVWKYLQLAQGNWREISVFIETNKQNHYLFPFLSTLTDKDLRDTPAAYLQDHLQEAPILLAYTPDNIIIPYVLSPRIATELIKPWRSFFQQADKIKEIAGEPYNAQNIIRYIKTTIQLSDEENYYNCLLTPRGVYELKIADRRSRDVFFVAVCRSLGIPARIETATGKPQYYEEGKWFDAVFEAETTAAVNPPKSQIVLINDPQNIVKPAYEKHYTLAVFKNGDFQTLDFWNNPAANHFPGKLTLDAGYYRLMTGSRANDGSVTVGVEYLELLPNKAFAAVVTLPKVEGKIAVRGSVDMNTIVPLDNNSSKTLKELANGRGLMLCIIDPGKEPSKHVLQDLPAQQKELEAWGGGIVLLTPSDRTSFAFDPSAFNNLPAQTTWITDRDRTLLKTITGALQLDFTDNFPLTVYITSNGGILYSSNGYRIGIGEDIVKMIELERESLKR